jgi:dienelactone hydrolase
VERVAILKAMQQLMGAFPGPEKRSPISVQIEEEVDCGDYLRRQISYESEPGSRVPAYLLIPKSAFSTPGAQIRGVLCLHPTNQQLGNKVVAGLGPDPSLSYALELTRRGLVTIAPAYPHLAGYSPDLAGLGYASGTMKAIWDNVRALDVLESLPYVKRSGFGAIGHSLGGHNAIFSAVFEPRIKVVVSSCGFDSFQDYYSGDPKMWKRGMGWTQDRYMPRLADYAGRLGDIPFDFDAIIAALAPRHVFVSAPFGDTNFQWRSVDRILTEAKRVYAIHGAEDHLQWVHPDCGHDFPGAVREQAYRFLEENLR